jgi:predicted small secreted protein
MKMNLQKKLPVVMLGVLFLALTACNTVEGFGEDVQKGGENLENSAKKHK